MALKPTRQEDVCRLENAVMDGNGAKLVAETKQGATVMNRNPWKYLVGTPGFDPRTPTVSIWFGRLTQFKYIN
jgi:hypothetical protein